MQRSNLKNYQNSLLSTCLPLLVTLIVRASQRFWIGGCNSYGMEPQCIGESKVKKTLMWCTLIAQHKAQWIARSIWKAPTGNVHQLDMEGGRARKMSTKQRVWLDVESHKSKIVQRTMSRKRTRRSLFRQGRCQESEHAAHFSGRGIRAPYKSEKPFEKQTISESIAKRFFVFWKFHSMSMRIYLFWKLIW